MSKEDIKEMENEFFAWIKYELWRNHQTQKWLASECGIELSTLNNYFNGVSRISLPVMLKIFEVLQPTDEQLGILLRRGE